MFQESILAPKGARMDFKKRSGSYSNNVQGTYSSYREELFPTYRTILQSEGSSTAILDERWFIGQDIPDYHKKRKEGVLLPHTRWRKLTRAGSYSSIPGDNVRDYVLNLSGNCYRYYAIGSHAPTYLGNAFITDDEIKAYAPSTYDQYVQEAAAKIYSNGYDALTAAAELVELRSLVSGSISLLVRMIRNGKLGIFDTVSAWMTGRYGWRTLVYDIMAINELIESWNDRRTRYSESCGNRYSYQEVSDTAYATLSWCKLRLNKMDDVTISMRGSVVADIVIPKLQFNPLATSWELVPLSFVMDWFVSVGKAISAVSFLSAQSNYFACKGFRVEVFRRLEMYIDETFGDYVSGDWHAVVNSRASYEVRDPCTVPITPHLTCRLNAFKIVDLGALISQRLRR